MLNTTGLPKLVMCSAHGKRNLVLYPWDVNISLSIMKYNLQFTLQFFPDISELFLLKIKSERPILPLENMNLKTEEHFMQCKKKDRQLLKKIHSYRQIY